MPGSGSGRRGVVVGEAGRRSSIVRWWWAAIAQALMAGLAGLAGGEPGAGAVVGRAGSVGKTVLVFPGQGSQRVGDGPGVVSAVPGVRRGV